MSVIRSKAKDKRLSPDEPSSLPEDALLDPGDAVDEATAAERHALDEAIRRGWESACAGRVRPATAIVDEVRARAN